MSSGVRKIFIFILVFAFLNASCSKNVFDGMVSKETDSALIYEAKKQMDKQDFSASIDALDKLSDSAKSTAEVKELYGSAYAGRCGMMFISFFYTMTQGNAGAVPLFQYFMKAFNDKAVIPADCATALQKMRLISTSAANRSGDENLFMAITSMATLGSFIRYKADVDGANSLGDGTVDAGFDVCANSATGFTDADIKEIVVAFSLLLENIAAVTAVISGSSAVTAISGLNVVCDAAALLNGGDNPCTKYTTADVTTSNVASFRDILDTQSAGLGTCVPGTVATPTLNDCCP